VAGLSTAERARAARFHRPNDSRRFEVAHGWLRHVLGLASGEPLLVEDGGKPRVGGGPMFNLSHAGDLAVIAVADRAVGVDVEPLGNGERALEAAAVACTPEEAHALDGLPAAQRADAFLALWTAKEAYLKATGVGLAVPPNRVHVGLPVIDRTRIPVGDGWWVQHLRPAPGYVGAVAARGRDWSVRTSTLDPVGSDG
jgi:4'-phosphopantetheinyl transferase